MDQVTPEERRRIEDVLAGVDEPVVCAVTQTTGYLRIPPLRKWPNPTVIPEPPKPHLVVRILLAVATPYFWVSDPIGEFIFWLETTVTLRRRKRAMRGRWRSVAGSLALAYHVPASVRSFLVAGRSGLHVVYLGELGAEVGWSVPREKIRGVDKVKRKGDTAERAVLRFRFVDRSWVDRAFRDASWKELLAELPSARKGG